MITFIYYLIWVFCENLSTSETFDIFPRSKKVKKTINLLSNEKFKIRENFEYNENYKNIPNTIFLTFYDREYLKIQKEAWSRLNPDFKIEIYDDNDCNKYLLEKFGKYHSNVFTDLIKDGPIKADYFRIHRLIEGGIYVDMDMEPINLDHYKNRIIIPYTVFPANKWIKYQLNPALIIIPPQHPLILQAIKAYKIISEHLNYEYWSYSIVTVLSALNIINKYKIPKIILETRKWYDMNPYNIYLYDRKRMKKLNKVRTKNYDKSKHKFIK
jgi:hypothetical protein